MPQNMPSERPSNPCFSSGPCAKRPGWSLSALSNALVGRSHRSKEGKARLNEVIERSKDVLDIPSDWRVGIVPASDTGAVEIALWSLLGERGVDVLAFESFSKQWAKDVKNSLKIQNARILSADYGALPDFSQINWDHDVVLAWNGTTSGVCIPSGDAIPKNHEGLVICDATSAAFVMDLPWDRLDVVTWSWQKALGGEAAHGMMALSPRAVERLQHFTPQRSLPKIFQLTKNNNVIIEGIFKGITINTPSMLCVEDALDGLKWAKKIGGQKQLKKRSEASLQAVEQWVGERDWIDFLAPKKIRSCTAICLHITAPWFKELSADKQKDVVKDMLSHISEQKAGYDLMSYRDAPAGIRIWAGATVETANIKALLPWLDWAYHKVAP